MEEVQMAIETECANCYQVTQCYDDGEAYICINREMCKKNARIASLEAERDAAQGAALRLAREWQEVITTLATVVLDDAETVTVIEFKPEIKCHPFYAGKLSLLKTLKEMADEDVRRHETDAGATILAELALARAVVEVVRSTSRAAAIDAALAAYDAARRA
jgi:pentose-5-phosphate-3-epimerase